MRNRSLKVLVVDLNNFAMYPTIAVGYLVAILKRQGVDVDVFSPLQFGVTGVAREPRETGVRHWMRRVNYELAAAQGAVAATGGCPVPS